MLRTPLRQMTLIGMRIAVRTAKGAHRTLSDMCGMPPRRPPVRLAVGATADTGAGPRATVVNLDAADLRHEPENDDTTGESGGRRILPWDPLTPRLVEGAQKLAAKGQERPLTAAAVVAAALPFSGLAVCVGAPVLACDAGLQWGASTPVGQAVGQCTQNALEVIRGLYSALRQSLIRSTFHFSKYHFCITRTMIVCCDTPSPPKKIQNIAFTRVIPGSDKKSL